MSTDNRGTYSNWGHMIVLWGKAFFLISWTLLLLCLSWSICGHLLSKCPGDCPSNLTFISLVKDKLYIPVALSFQAYRHYLSAFLASNLMNLTLAESLQIPIFPAEVPFALVNTENFHWPRAGSPTYSPTHLYCWDFAPGASYILFNFQPSLYFHCILPFAPTTQIIHWLGTGRCDILPRTSLFFYPIFQDPRFAELC